jgi:hypothetical protein
MLEITLGDPFTPAEIKEGDDGTQITFEFTSEIDDSDPKDGKESQVSSLSLRLYDVRKIEE